MRRRSRCKAFDFFLFMLIFFMPFISAMGMPPQPEAGHDVEPANPVVVRLAEYLDPECTVADIHYGPEEPTPSQKRCKNDVIIETSNTTGWTALEERLLYSHADVLLAQEHWITSDNVEEKKQKARKLGWKSIWAPAIKTGDEACTDNRMVSAGVAIFVRKYLGLTHLELDGAKIATLEEGRLVPGVLSAPGLGQIVVYAAYLHCGVGLSSINKDIVGKIKENAEQHGMPWLCGADWNVEPDVIANSDLPRLLNARILATSAPTCMSPTTSHTLDYFLVEKSLASAIKAPYVIEEATTRPHRPVQAAITANLSDAKVQKFKEVQRLPTEAVIGPKREPQSYVLASKAAASAKDEFTKGNFEEGRRFFSLAFKEWASKAEIEVAQASDTVLRGGRSRGDKPAKALRPLLPRATGIRDPPKLGKLVGALQCLQGVSALLSTAWKKGSRTWTELIANTARVCRYIQSNSEIKLDIELKTRIEGHLDDVLKFAAAGEAQPDDAQAMQWQSYSALNCTAAAIRKDINGIIKVEKAKIQKEHLAAWDDWRYKDLSGNCAGSHKFSKPAKGWQPPEVRDENGKLVADSAGILKEEAKKYKLLWGASSVPPPKKYADNAPCERALPDKLRRLSRSFKKRTGVAPDGWHPRHFAQVSDAGLTTLAELYEVFELCGYLPEQQEMVFIFLLDKASGGTRPIGLFTALYRLWAKLRQADAARWAGLHDRVFFAAGRCRSTVDPAWRNSVRNQRARAVGDNVATLSWDLRKFYERVSHAKLRQRAIEHHFPLAIVDCAINAYKMARVITYDGLAGDDLYPNCGTIAGDSLSDCLIKLYYLDVFDQTAEICTVADIRVYFDDLQATCRGSPDFIADGLKLFVDTMLPKIEQDLEATLALDKASVTTDCPKLCDRLHALFGDVAGPRTEVAPFSGVDELNGLPRANLPKTSKWKTRQREAKDKKGKLTRLAAGTGTNASRVFTAGVLPAATHGVEVIGVNDTELNALRDLALATIKPGGRVRSRKALLVARGDPVWRPATAPIARWALEVWLNSVPRESAVEAIPLDELEDIWQEASKRWPKTWRGSRGALDAAVLSTRRINWAFDGPRVLVTDQGVRIPLELTAPKLLSVMLRDAVQRAWQRRLADSLKAEGFGAERVCPDPIRHVCASSWAKSHGL